MATDVQAWCRETKSEKWTDDREVDIVGQYLDGTLTATEAAEKLTEYVDRRNTAENKVGRIWTLLQLCAVECADLHEQLIDLIEAIVACSPSKRTGGVDWTEQETSFKETWRDYYDSLSASLQDKTEYQRASNVSIAQRWTNFHAFSALLATSGLFGDDFGLVSGLAVIVAALEAKSSTSWEIETDLPAALQWLLHASKIIYRNGRSMGTDWDSGSELWNGQAGSSQERWKFWKERMEGFQNDDGIDEEVKHLLRMAGVAMGKAERAKK